LLLAASHTPILALITETIKVVTKRLYMHPADVMEGVNQPKLLVLRGEVVGFVKGIRKEVARLVQDREQVRCILDVVGGEGLLTGSDLANLLMTGPSRWNLRAGQLSGSLPLMNLLHHQQSGLMMAIKYVMR
jgi:hypothetical protein